MAAFLSGMISESWWVLAEAAPWVLFGFLAAGFIRAFVHDETVARHLGGSNVGFLDGHAAWFPAETIISQGTGMEDQYFDGDICPCWGTPLPE